MRGAPVARRHRPRPACRPRSGSTGDHEFYDFEAKYLPEEATELDVPADLPDDVATELRALAARAFEAVGCEGLARVDFFVMPDGSLVVNEINTMPGLHADRRCSRGCGPPPAWTTRPWSTG